MRVIYSDAHRQHHPQFELYDGQKSPLPETVDRVESILNELNSRKLGKIEAPKKFGRQHIYSIHSRQYVDFLRQRCQQIRPSEDLYPSYFISDTYAPMNHGTYAASVAAVNCALTGANYLLNGEPVVYSLCRPPGHHAEHSSMGGYCYFNNAAIASDFLSTHGTVAILDIDFHHGNGTQGAFYDRQDVLYVSLHADPRHSYPFRTGFSVEKGAGAGTGFNINIPLPRQTENRTYLAAIDRAIRSINNFQPDFLVISAGFDTFKDDPIGGLGLTLAVYPKIAAAIAGLNTPTLVVQEGGYDVQHLGRITADFLQSFEARVLNS